MMTQEKLGQLESKALESEKEEPLGSEDLQGNKRNGSGKKKIKSSTGFFEPETPQDRWDSFGLRYSKSVRPYLLTSFRAKYIGLYGFRDDLTGHQFPYQRNVRHRDFPYGIRSDHRYAGLS